jgi:transposase
MLGEKERDFKIHHIVSLEDLVPADNFYRQLEAKLDLSFVRDLVRDCYADGVGRPSVDPVVFFKLQLIMFFEDFRSERQLMDQVHLNLAFRWYIGYDLDEPVPNHSSLSKIRDRLGLSVFQHFFEQVVQWCIDAGLVWGKELHFDGTVAEANADYDRRVPRFYWQAHLKILFGDEEQTRLADVEDRHLVHKYDGQQRVVRASHYTREVDYWVSPVDPDATPMGKFKLAYRTHYVVDGGQARIILGCLVTPSTIQDNTPMIDLAWWLRFRWQLPLEVAVADQKYGTIDNILALAQGGVKAYVPLMADGSSRRTKLFPRSMFRYDAEQDRYICPQGESLYYTRTHQDVRFYRTKGNVCKACPIRRQCTTSKLGRAISHSIHKAALDRVAAFHETDAYRKAMRKRQVWVEPKFAESKLWHQGRRFRLRRIHKVNIEGLLRASVQNIKQLLKDRPRWEPPAPVGAVNGGLKRLFFAFSMK